MFEIAQPAITPVEPDQIELNDVFWLRRHRLKIANAARGCYGKDAEKMDDEKLVHFLHQLWTQDPPHITPFEHVILTVYVIAPIEETREWNRHRHISPTEQSTRYTKNIRSAIPPACFYGYLTTDRLSSECTPMDGWGIVWNAPRQVVMAWNDWVKATEASFDAYDHAIDMGVPRDSARSILPLCTTSRITYTGNLSAWRHFVDLRASKRAHEHIRRHAYRIQGMLSCILGFKV